MKSIPWRRKALAWALAPIVLAAPSALAFDSYGSITAEHGRLTHELIGDSRGVFGAAS